MKDTFRNNHDLIAIGTAKGSYVDTKIDLELLEQVVKSLKTLNYTAVTISVEKDRPILFGNGKQGILVAPLEEEE